MVYEIGWYQKVINGLELILPPSLNFEEFYRTLEIEQNERDIKSARHKALELVKRTLAVRKNDGIGKIQIVIGAVRGEKQVYIASHNEQGELEIISDRPVHETQPRKPYRPEFARADTASQTIVSGTERPFQELTEAKTRIEESKRGKRRNPLKISNRTLLIESISSSRLKLSPVNLHSFEVAATKSSEENKDDFDSVRLEKRSVDQIYDFEKVLTKPIQTISSDATIAEIMRYIQKLQGQRDQLQTDLLRTREIVKVMEHKNQQLREQLLPHNQLDFKVDGCSIRVKCEQLRTQNEELQLKLNKANTKIDRLNQLIQRKENQFTGRPGHDRRCVLELRDGE
jgi:outer membrane murein-binding lipoprotein Lpp